MAAPIEIEVTARLDKFIVEMGRLGPEGAKSAKAMGAQFSREIRAMTKATQDAGKASKAARDEVAGLGDVAGKAGSNTMKLAGAASMASPALGDMTRNAGDAFDVLEVLGTLPAPLAAGLGAVAVAAAAGALAWTVYNADAADTAKISAKVQEAQAALAPILDATRLASIDLEQATGKLNETQAKHARDQLAAWNQLRDATTGARAEIADLQKQQQSWGTIAVDTIEAVADAGGEWNVVGNAMGYYTRKLFTDSEDLTKQIDAQNGVIRQGAAETKVLVETTKAATEADAKGKAGKDALRASTDKLKDATAEQAAALKEAIAASAEEAKINEDARNSLDALRQVGEDAALSALKGEEAVVAKRDESLRQLEAMYQASVALQQTDADRLEAAAAYTQSQVEIEEVAQAEITRIRAEQSEKRVEIAEDLAKKEAHIQRSSAEAAASIAGSSADLLGAIREGLTEDQKEAAMALFIAQKAAGIAEATLNTGVAVSNALATPGVPYPVAVAFGIAAGIAGAANIAAVASTPAPTFSDTPGPVMAGNGVGRTSVNVSAGDMVVASRTREGLRAQVDPYATRTDGGGNMTVINRRTFGATVRDDVRINSPLARLSAAGSASVGFR
jgi:hypothetical protein